MKEPKPVASLSLDLDNKWSYMKTHGDSGWDSYPSYLDIVVPRALKFLKERNLTITFFIVGQDAALDKNREVLRTISDSGHEIGNHSFHHEPWLHLYSDSQIDAEMAMAEKHIEEATGRRPIGFRGPGFSLSDATLQVLARRGYLYDATTFPTFLGPLARAYYFMTAKLSAEEKRQRSVLFGTVKEGLRSIQPYLLQTTAGQLVEIPVTTLPILKLPFHVSYVLYLSRFSTALAVNYFRTAIQLCRVTGSTISLLLHPLDFLGSDDRLPELDFFPGMGLSSEQKLEVVGRVLELLCSHFSVLTVEQHAREAMRARLPVRQPDFSKRAWPLSEGTE